jgi:DNA-binding MarR family transcriptional regulator
MDDRGQQKNTLRADAARHIESCPGLHARLAARRISQFLDIELSSVGLTLAQLGLMAHIAVASDDTIGALAERIGLDQSTLSRNLRGLEADGLVEIAIVESDLRRRVVWLTETGVRRLKQALPVWRAAQAKLRRHLSVDMVRKIAEGAGALISD